jgi:cell wall assembly regulator SMI1
VKGNVGVQLPEDVGQLLLGHDGQLQHWVVVRLEA